VKGQNVTMRVGAFIMPQDHLSDPDGLAQFGRAAEVMGLAAIWMGEHVVWFDQYDSPWPYSPDGTFSPDPQREHLEIFEALAFLAAVTERIRLGTGITLVPQRNPVYTAKSVMSVDVLSKGRFDFGVGIGWNRAEFDATAMPWAERGARTDDYLQVMRSLWTEDPSHFSGRFYDLAPCHLHPKPVQQPHPPIHVSGHSPGALRRAAALGQGWYGWWTTPEETAAIVADLAHRRASSGRARESFQVTVTPPPDLDLDADVLRAYETAGVDLLLPRCSWQRGDHLEQALAALGAMLAAAQHG
jgi:probable F420-dependent oxidoreductase